jgi:hypothetical protein
MPKAQRKGTQCTLGSKQSGGLNFLSSKEWSAWRPFPNPRLNEELVAPIGPGCYELRHRSTRELILHGAAARTAHRITSILPYPYGCGTNDNVNYRNYIFQKLDDVEYRTIAFRSLLEARVFEVELFNGSQYRFRRNLKQPRSETLNFR